MTLKESHWPLQKITMPRQEWFGVLAEPICLLDDLDASLEARLSALEDQLSVRVSRPADEAFWAFAFRNVPGLWPPGWGPAGPLKAKKPRGRPKRSPDNIAGTVEALKAEGWSNKEAWSERMRELPEFRSMSAAAIQSAYYREIDAPQPSTANMLAVAFGIEDEKGETIYQIPDDDLTQRCLQSFSDWSAILGTVWPEQRAILTRYFGFRGRTVVLSRYIFALRKSD